MKKLSVAILLIASAGAHARNDHLYPNITDFELPYLSIKHGFSTEITGLKGKKEAGGKEESLRATLDTIGFGFKKERVDYRYSYIDASYGRSSGGELDYANSEIIIQNLYSFRYGEGSHIGRSASMDWNVYIAVESADFELGFETKTQVGAGLGGELAYSLTSWLDLKASMHYSPLYRGMFVGADINF